MYDPLFANLLIAALCLTLIAVIVGVAHIYNKAEGSSEVTNSRDIDKLTNKEDE